MGTFQKLYLFQNKKLFLLHNVKVFPVSGEMFPGDPRCRLEVEDDLCGQSCQRGQAHLTTQVPGSLSHYGKPQTIAGTRAHVVIAEDILSSLNPSAKIRNLDGDFLVTFNHQNRDGFSRLSTSVSTSLYSCSYRIQENTVQDLPDMVMSQISD